VDLHVAGKTYVIVGGTRDVGFEAARTLAADGAGVVLIGRSSHGARRAADEIHEEFGATALGLGADASMPGEVEDAVQRAASRFGRIDGLLTTVGPIGRNVSIAASTDDDFEISHQQIYMSAVRSCRAVIPHLVANGGGAIVTTSAYSIRSPKPTHAGYGAMKSAVATFTKNLAKTHGPDGIRANCVCPGALRAGVVRAAIEHRAAEQCISTQAAELQLLAEWSMTVALGRLGEAEEIGAVMAFLLSPRAAYLTGSLINIDGGTDF